MPREPKPVAEPPSSLPILPVDLLPLSSRYGAAWGEHSTRIAQRQSVIQMYLAVAGVIYGYYFSRNAGERANIEVLFIGGITAITLASSLLMCMHNRVIGELTVFMMRCEECAAQSIKARGGKVNLFYFYDDETGKLARFHTEQRMAHRCLLAALLGLTNGYAIYCTSSGPDDHLASWVAGGICLLAMFLMVFDIFFERLLPRR